MNPDSQTYTKFTCRRCTKIVELPGGSFMGWKVPSGWKKINNLLICSACVRDHNSGYQKWFSQFMREGKQQ